MKKMCFISILIFISFSALQAQKSLDNPLIDSKKIITKASALQEDGKYKQAVENYLKVSASDTNYSDVL